MLRTQVDPYVLVGNLADLPSPADIAQGTLFHAEDTGDCRILVINTLSGVRYWDLFCGTSGASGTAPIDSFEQAFSGDTSGADTTQRYMSNAGPATAGTAPLNYRYGAARTIIHLNGYITANNTAGAVTVTIWINGAIVFTVVTPAAANTAFDSGALSIPVPVGARVDVGILASTSGQVAAVSLNLRVA